MDYDIETDFLVGRSSFLEGVGRIFDLAGAMNVYEISETPAEADAKALASDFAIVGNALRGAI